MYKIDVLQKNTPVLPTEYTTVLSNILSKEDILKRLECMFPVLPIYPTHDINNIMYKAGQQSVINAIKEMRYE